MSPAALDLCRWIGVLALLVHCFAGMESARAQADRWDGDLEDSYWCVPQGNMQAYTSSSTSFADPQAIGDQTLWHRVRFVVHIFLDVCSALEVS